MLIDIRITIEHLNSTRPGLREPFDISGFMIQRQFILGSFTRAYRNQLLCQSDCLEVMFNGICALGVLGV